MAHSIGRRHGQLGAVKRSWLLAAVVVALGAGGWWLWRGHTAGGAEGATNAAASGGGGGALRRFGSGGAGGAGGRPQPVSVQPVQRQDVRVMVTAVGTLVASNTAVVHVQTSGVLQALHFKEGQAVRAGQVLAQIDPRPAQIALAQAEGNLARDKAQLDNARVDLQRYQDLLSKDAAPRQQVDTQAALVRQLEGTVKTDMAAVDNAKLQVTYTQVLSPIAGRAGIKQVDIGNVVQASDTNGVVTITQTRPMALLFSVPSVHVPKIQAALHGARPLAVEVWSRDGKTRLATGRVGITDNAIDTTTDTLKLKAELPNNDDALFPNQTVEARLQVDTVAQALTVPVAGVQTGAKGTYLYVVGDDGTVHVRPVKPGPIEGDRMAVEGQLAVGEQVVIDGIDRLRDGAKVAVERPEAAAGAPGKKSDTGGAKAPRESKNGAAATPATAPAGKASAAASPSGSNP